MADYESLASFAQIWGTLSFVAFFALVLIYALNPKKGATFAEASRIPLEKD
ncbi:cbb3-type cytochrome c oxidase subunit 3 [Alsobacter sp. SYSU M60028]|uniref:Cbb3-type cytochrome c oxidase subunit 3 n=1 Tax=Alsobacter ponti TaxID=2962936 RepID=A0ABT1L7S1_9HYPH|nr:cbb3-type cytochrome c oxidase subunit 3 [Alsobacter ponti]MCP8936983.1 cbb3-type cytochrome c oxidase subunit 3 [Alsobacter ponti]